MALHVSHDLVEFSQLSPFNEIAAKFMGCANNSSPQRCRQEIFGSLKAIDARPRGAQHDSQFRIRFHKPREQFCVFEQLVFFVAKLRSSVTVTHALWMQAPVEGKKENWVHREAPFGGQLKRKALANRARRLCRVRRLIRVRRSQ
jgi:hypothetical protein